MVLRAVSICVFTFLPNEWVEEGLPNSDFKKFDITSTTSGATGVVAALSKYAFIQQRECVVLFVESRPLLLLVLVLQHKYER